MSPVKATTSEIRFASRNRISSSRSPAQPSHCERLNGIPGAASNPIIIIEFPSSLQVAAVQSVVARLDLMVVPGTGIGVSLVHRPQRRIALVETVFLPVLVEG